MKRQKHFGVEESPFTAGSLLCIFAEFQGYHLVERIQFHSYHDSQDCWLNIAHAMTPADRDGYLPGAGQSLVAAQFRVRIGTP